jgi:Ca2+-binding EF-hand superfamily protein
MDALAALQAQDGSRKSTTAKRSSVSEESLKEVFMKFDPNRDGTGALTLTDFQKLLNHQGIDLSKKEVKSLFRKADTSGGDGSKLTIQWAAFDYMYEKAKGRAALKSGAAGGVRDKRQHLKLLYEEFKEKNINGAEGITKEGLEEVAKFLLLKLEKKEIDHAYKQIKGDKPNAVLSFVELNKFFDNAKAKEELAILLEDLRGDYRTNTVFQQKLYESFDSSGEGSMTTQDLKSVMLFLPTIVEMDVNQSTIDKLVAKTGKGGVVTLDQFCDFFQQMKGIKNTKEIISDFDNSDKPKTMFGAALAFVVFCIAVSMIVFGTQMETHVVTIAGIVALLFSVYIGLYTAGYSIECCGESRGMPGAPNKLPGHLAMIFFALAGASYAYGVLMLARIDDWVEQITLLWILLGAAFLSCRCAAHAPVIGVFFRNPSEITEKELESHIAEENKKKKFIYEEDSSVGSPKSPSSPKTPKKKRDSELAQSAGADLEAGLPGEVTSNEAMSPKMMKPRSSSIKPSPGGDMAGRKSRASLGGEPLSPQSAKSGRGSARLRDDPLARRDA